jgi:hypothetical protein
LPTRSLAPAAAIVVVALACNLILQGDAGTDRLQA